MVIGKHPIKAINDTLVGGTDGEPRPENRIYIMFLSQEAANLLDNFAPKFNDAIDAGNEGELISLHKQLSEQTNTMNLPAEDYNKLIHTSLLTQMIDNARKSAFKDEIKKHMYIGSPINVNALAIQYSQTGNTELLKNAREAAERHNPKCLNIEELTNVLITDNFDSKDPFARIKARFALGYARREQEEQEKARQQSKPETPAPSENTHQPSATNGGWGNFKAARDLKTTPVQNGNDNTTTPAKNNTPSISKWKIAAGYYLCYSYSAACYALGAVRTDINYIEKGGISIPDLDTTKPVWRDENEHVLRVPNRLLVRLMSGYLINDFNSDIWKKPPPLGSDFNSNLWRVPSPLGWVFLTGFGTMVIGINTDSPKVERAGIAIANTAATPLKGIYGTLFDFAGYGKNTEAPDVEEEEERIIPTTSLKFDWSASTAVPKPTLPDAENDYNVTSITLNDTALNAEQINNLTKYTLDMEEQTPTSTLSPS